LSARIHGDAELEVLSLESKPIEHGTYPVNFAEGEAWEILSNEFMDYEACDTITEANKLLAGIIAGLVQDGVLGEYTPKRGAFYKW
jgi:hypothetical protein